MMNVQAIKKTRKTVKSYGRKFSTQQMGVQVSHRIYTKYRRKIDCCGMREDIRDIIRDLFEWKGVTIIEGKVMPDHIHLLLSIPPKYSVSSFMGYLKGKNAIMIFERHANLKYKFGNRHFWATGYYVSTVGIQEKALRKCIQEQEKQDQMMDKTSTKEYEKRDRRKFCVIDVPRQYENLRLSQE